MNVLSSPRSRVEGKDAQHPADDFVPTAERLAMLAGTILPFVALVLGIVLLWGRGINLLDLGLMLGMYTLTILGISVGFHRQLTHRAFSTGPVIRFTLAALGSMSMQGSVIQWVAIHRRHHQESDREGDPHSPHNFGHGFRGMMMGMWHSHMGWLYKPDPPDLSRSVTDLLHDPAVCAADRLFWPLVFLGIVIPGAIGGLVYGTWAASATAMLWGGPVRIFLLHHATFSINSICHIWGTRPFRNVDHSRNNVIFGVLSFGEGWHNNHHAFPTSAKHGLHWWQLDLGWWLIAALQASGLAWDVRRPSASDMQLKRHRRSSADKTSPAPTTFETTV